MVGLCLPELRASFVTVQLGQYLFLLVALGEAPWQLQGKASKGWPMGADFRQKLLNLVPAWVRAPTTATPIPDLGVSGLGPQTMNRLFNWMSVVIRNFPDALVWGILSVCKVNRTSSTSVFGYSTLWYLETHQTVNVIQREFLVIQQWNPYSQQLWLSFRLHKHI